MTEQQVYRGVTVELHNPRKPQDGTYEIHLKPYESPAPAKASVTIRRNRYSKQVVDGWVEVATVWERLDD